MEKVKDVKSATRGEAVIPTDAPDIMTVMTYALELTTRLDQNSILQSLVESARTITGAKYSALGIVDSHGKTLQFVFSGLSQSTAEKIGHPPLGKGMFSDIPPDDRLIINDLETYGNRSSWPKFHPVMKNFLGVPIRAHGRVLGRLYLADKETDFTELDGDNITLLGQAAAIAVENARLFEESNRRAQWIAASRSITATLLENSDEEESLELISHEMRRVAHADVSLLVLPSIGDTWVCEIATGENSFEYIGLSFPEDSYAQMVIREGNGMVTDSTEAQNNRIVPELAHFGPALYAPMVARGETLGVIVLLRNPSSPSFDLSDLSMAENVAKQAALALELSENRQSDAEAELMEERARVARDLHDFAIQQLFATGMELSAARDTLAAEGVDLLLLEALDRGIGSIDESVTQIRQIIYSLRDPNATVPLMSRLRHEFKQATNSLGFPLDVHIQHMEEIIDDEEAHTEIDDEIGSDIADDLVAVTRECLSNAARHSEATAVSVQLIINPTRVSLVIEDNGKGISGQVSRRSGLSNLAARARRYHGSFSIHAGQDGTGTCIEWIANIA